MKYTYAIEKPKEFITKITDPEKFVVDAMNAVGAKGGEIIGQPVEFQEPSTLTDAQNRPMMQYGVILFIKYAVTEDQLQVGEGELA